jgi:AcrR family transcriptional regulator
MVRWQPDARERLAQAASELFAERGFEQTTVAQIAARAGLTERTFFRHYADKREMLFGRSGELQQLFVDAVTNAPADASPFEAVAAALTASAAAFTDRAHSRARQAIIDSEASLQERELIKMSQLARGVAEALRARGVPEPAASLAAQTGIGAFHVTFMRWVADGSTKSFETLLNDSLAELRRLIVAP